MWSDFCTILHFNVFPPPCLIKSDLPVFRLQTARDATHVESEKLPTLGAAVAGCQPRFLTDTTMDIRDSLTMDIIMAGPDTIIPSQELTKDSSASEDDHPEPKT